jgi:microcystin-dependent protein
MKPLNLDNSPCSPISSNCVIWSGQSIPCIKLCTGDTVSDVVFKLATELCTIMDELNVSNYDLACLNLGGCDPKDFQALIQLLINKICELENLPAPTPTPDGGTCPDSCIVAVAECLGGGTDSLTNYVQTIANRVCQLVSDISIIQSSISTINTTLVSLQTQINNIPTYTLPDITLPCDISPYLTGQSVALDTLFEAFLEVWCASSGNLGNISSVLNPSCTLTGSAYFGSDIVSQPGWINPPATLADAISNIWTSICFFYDFNYAQTVVTGSGAITVTPTYNAVTNTTTYEVSSPAFMPAGVVVPWASPNPTPPIGWLLCDGDYVTQTDYPDLYAAIGTTYGSLGAGSFRLPIMANSIPVGLGTNANGYDLTTVGNTGGNRVETLTAAQIPPHTHSLATATVGGTINATVTGTASGGSHTHDITGDLNGGIGGSPTGFQLTNFNNPSGFDNVSWIQDGAHSHTVTGTATGPFTGTISGDTDNGSPALQGLPHGNMQPYIVMQYIIKY